MKFWDKKIRINILIGLAVWAIFSLVVLTGLFSVSQMKFNDFAFSSSAPLSAESFIFVIVSLLFEGLILILLINNIKPAYSLAAPFSLLVLYYIAMRIFAGFGVRLDFFFSFFFGMAVYLINIVYNYLSFDKERQEIKKTFQYYLAPEYIEKLAENPEHLKLGGEEKEMTIFFSDIRGFSSISEKLSVKDLVQLLNEYLTAMTDIVMENKGVVDKYIGDAVMAFWGAPLDDAEHSSNSVKAGLEMLKKLEELNNEWQKKSWPEIKIGIGVNTGEVMVGNMGSSRRFNYTVMGDNVNLASRLEGLTKYYGTPLIVGEKVYENVKDKYCARPLDTVAVKGKKQPIKIFEILGEKKFENNWADIISLTQKALELYYGQKWDEAIKAFEKLAEIDKKSRISELFIGRCRELKKNHPSGDWNGVWEMETK